MIGRRRICCLAASRSAGCMWGPDYERPQTSLPTAYSDAAPADVAPARIQADWWTLYDDPMLNSLPRDCALRQPGRRLLRWPGSRKPTPICAKSMRRCP